MPQHPACGFLPRGWWCCGSCYAGAASAGGRQCRRAVPSPVPDVSGAAPHPPEQRWKPRVPQGSCNDLSTRYAAVLSGREDDLLIEALAASSFERAARRLSVPGSVPDPTAPHRGTRSPRARPAGVQPSPCPLHCTRVRQQHGALAGRRRLNSEELAHCIGMQVIREVFPDGGDCTG